MKYTQQRGGSKIVGHTSDEYLPVYYILNWAVGPNLTLGPKNETQFGKSEIVYDYIDVLQEFYVYIST